MEEKNHTQGVWTALATPFLENGEIDWQAFHRLVDHQTSSPVKGLVICGTTGESPALTVQEKLALIKKARARTPSHIKIMAGTGGSNTTQSVELSKLAVEAGADSLLVVTPPLQQTKPKWLNRAF